MRHDVRLSPLQYETPYYHPSRSIVANTGQGMSLHHPSLQGSLNPSLIFENWFSATSHHHDPISSASTSFPRPQTPILGGTSCTSGRQRLIMSAPRCGTVGGQVLGYVGQWACRYQGTKAIHSHRKGITRQIWGQDTSWGRDTTE